MNDEKSTLTQGPYRHPGQSAADRETARLLAREMRTRVAAWDPPSGEELELFEVSLKNRARLTRSLVAAAEITGKQQWLDAALAAAATLPEHGARETGSEFFNPGAASTGDQNDDGYRPSDDGYRPREAAMVVMALDACGRLAGRQDLALRAEEILRTLWSRAYIPCRGFQEEVRLNQPGCGSYRLDTQLHIMEALYRLLTHPGAAEWRSRWLELAKFTAARFFDAENGCLCESLRFDLSEDWEITGGRIHYGHNMMAARSFNLASRYLEEPGLWDLGGQLLDFVLDAHPIGSAVPGASAPGASASGAFAGCPDDGPDLGGSSRFLFRTAPLVQNSETALSKPNFSFEVQCAALSAMARRYHDRPSSALLCRLKGVWEAIEPFNNGVLGTRAEDSSANCGHAKLEKGRDWINAAALLEACRDASADLSDASADLGDAAVSDEPTV